MALVPSRNTRSYIYRSDANEDYTYRQRQEIAEQEDPPGTRLLNAVPMTGVQASTTPWPRRWRKRAVVCVDATTGLTAYVTAPTTDSLLWTDGGTSIQLHRSDGTVGTYNRIGVRPERIAPLNKPGP